MSPKATIIADKTMTSPQRKDRVDKLVLPGIQDKTKDVLGGFFLTDIDVDMKRGGQVGRIPQSTQHKHSNSALAPLPLPELKSYNSKATIPYEDLINPEKKKIEQ